MLRARKVPPTLEVTVINSQLVKWRYVLLLSKIIHFHGELKDVQAAEGLSRE